ncbi:unnamed protein product [Pedinophyceae sp. YPF-701]|nr:unnamed protein product [Pedinophyceae sp. YPF-701]
MYRGAAFGLATLSTALVGVREMGKPAKELQGGDELVDRIETPQNPVLFACQSIYRTTEFWRRAIGIYGAYKVAQVRAAIRHAQGESEESLQEGFWADHHAWAGREMYKLSVDLRGFYLKTGQFFGARADFIPLPICKELSKLHDQVPPMPAQQAKKMLTEELGVPPEEVFEWIDFDTPLGSASISQVHHARLRPGMTPERLAQLQQEAAQQRARSKGAAPAAPVATVPTVTAQDESVVHRAAAKQYPPGIDVAAKEEFQDPDYATRVPEEDPTRLTSRIVYAAHEIPPHARDTFGMVPTGVTGARDDGSGKRGRWGWLRWLGFWRKKGALTKEGAVGAEETQREVAVKIQYPGALDIMTQDLVNIRAAAGFLQRTEIQFDMVSAIDELARQIRMEFDFTREAEVMDKVADDLMVIDDRVTVPRSVPGLVTPRVLVMEYIKGTQIMKLEDKFRELSKMQRQAAARLLLDRLSDAYGHMILGSGLFQADCHPGNILVMEGGRIGLIDYGQSKQLTDEERKSFATMVVEMERGDKDRVCEALWGMGVVTDNPNELSDEEYRSTVAVMATGMFDTRGRVDPFDPDSPIKKVPVKAFPADMFFILRTVQLLRGLKEAMELEKDYSVTDRWVKLARKAQKDPAANSTAAAAASFNA